MPLRGQGLACIYRRGIAVAVDNLVFLRQKIAVQFQIFVVRHVHAALFELQLINDVERRVFITF